MNALNDRRRSEEGERKPHPTVPYFNRW